MFKEKIRVLLLGGSLTDHGSYADGNYQGYPVVITTESTVYHVRINAVSTQDPDNAQLAQYLDNILDLSELTGSYYSELFIGYGLTLLCSVRRIIDAFRTSSGSYRMKKAQ